MPFLDQIVAHINDVLKAGSLNAKKLKPAAYYGLTSLTARKTSGKALEQLPTILNAKGIAALITPDSKKAIQIYHRLLTNTYSLVKASYGDSHFIKCVSELNLVVLTNSKLTGRSKDVLEPAVLFGIPQKISSALLTDLGLNSCLVQPASSNMDALQVFRQEYPSSVNFFLNEECSMFSIKYKVDMEFSQDCVEKCLCTDEPA